MALVRFQQFYRFAFGVGVIRSDASHEDWEDYFAPVELAVGEDAHCEGEDVRDAGVSVGEEGGLVGGGEEGLAGEH